jgi:ATP-dependent Clp protease ATP-binding subunit ClpX
MAMPRGDGRLDENFYREAVGILESVPRYTPEQITKKIKSNMYVGQEQAVTAVSLMAFRHLARLRNIFIKKIEPEKLPPKTNMLFVGPTGCGKTYLVEILFRDIFKLPTVIVDMTNYSETGYVGQDVSSIITRLLYAADLNPVKAGFGIVCLDEFDKIASGQNNAVFAGAGTTKDVSGLGVQRELLKILESTQLVIPLELNHADYSPKTLLSSSNIAFIACGAFSGLKGIIEQGDREHIGFGRQAMTGAQGRIAVSYTSEEVDLAKNFLSYGFLPELMGRFKRYIPFQALSHDQLKSILHGKVLKQYIHEFELEGIKLSIAESVLTKVIEESMRKETGARGLEASFIAYLEKGAYKAYSAEGVQQLHLCVKNEEVVFELS